MVLPLLPGRNYTLTLDLGVPAQALAAADAGLYLDGKQLAPLKNESRLETTLPPASGDTIELELRSKAWVPKQAIAGSEDPRVLGVQAFSLVMKAEGATPPGFRCQHRPDSLRRAKKTRKFLSP